ncbi:hypothetical protein V8J36_12490 [Frigidibacter sp. MR17.14]|uniref:hypothetical protein n=1 Tax=Frigidibacter sp. MR17.14 TaxID=3126509 RepID=UPI003012FE98
MTQTSGPAGMQRPAGRIGLAAIGAAAGLSGWLLGDALVPVLGDGALQLVAIVYAASFFSAWLALAGHLPGRRALALSALVALPVAALAALSSPRFDTVAALISSDEVIPALSLLGLMPLPFLLAPGAGAAAVLAAGWGLALRAVVGLLFTLLCWAVIWLCDTLLGLVGLHLLEPLFRRVEALPWAITGAIFGLGLAVMAEAAGQVPLALASRMLRLILPPLALVLALFLLVLPFGGFALVFREVSAAGTMLAIGFGAVGLLALLAAARDESGRVERLAARGLSLALVPLAAMAGWAVLARVQAYGLTPERVAALLLVAVLAGLAIGHAAAALRGGAGWLGAVARVDRAMALVVWALAALVLTPLLDPYRLAAASQVARFGDGRTPEHDLPLEELRFDWGRAGTRALARLRAQAEAAGAAELVARIDALSAAQGRSPRGATPRPDPAALVAALVIRPAGAGLPAGLDLTVAPWEQTLWARACAARDAQGRPGCVLVAGDFRPDLPGEEAMLFLLADGRVTRLDFASGARRGPAVEGPEGAAATALMARLHAGEFRLAPAPVTALELDGADGAALWMAP